MDKYFLAFSLHVQKILPAADCGNLLPARLLLSHGQADLILKFRIAHGQTGHKPVRLGCRKGIGPRGAVRVLGGNHQKWPGYLAADPIHRNLPLLHHLQKSRLGFGGSPVNLVRQKQVAEHRSWLIHKGLPVFSVDGKSRQVRGHHIRRKLHPSPGQPHGSGKSQGQGGLSHSRHVLQQNMSPCQHGRQNLLRQLLLAVNDLIDRIQNLPGLFSVSVHGSLLLSVFYMPFQILNLRIMLRFSCS